MNYPDDHAAWKRLVAQEMAEKSALNWFALADPCSDGRLPAILWELEDNAGILPLFMNTMLHEVSMAGPLFVPLRASSPLAGWILEESGRVPVGVIYGVEERASSALFEHLQNLLECRLPEGGSGLFRFFDPRVLYAVAGHQNPEWRRLLLGQAEVLHAWEPGCRRPVSLAGPGRALEEEGWEMRRDLLEAIAHHTSPYAVIHWMDGGRGEALRAMPLPEAYAWVREIRDSLAELGWSSLRDFMTGASLCLQLGTNIFEEEELRGMLLAERNAQGLPEAVKTIPDAWFEKKR
ncbi:MAG: DUF4123 domain-containing protein [Deltaproteobacteria bacterium]|jgi:hypothetical protein|nr:DUF4123 domain-containing protein [Deltaproteobacteria bacterium]